MQYTGSQYIQLRKTSFVLGGTLSNLIAGALEVEIYTCAECGKLEFYQYDDSKREIQKELPFEKCPKCGDEHNTGLAMCPKCVTAKYWG